MKVTYENGDLSICLLDILHKMTDEEKLEIAESIACQSSVIKFVGQQIITGWTENASRGVRDWGEEEPYTELDKVIREIAEKSSDVAQKEIKRLCDLVKYQKEQIKKEHEKLFALEKKYNDLIDRQRSN